MVLQKVDDTLTIYSSNKERQQNRHRNAESQVLKQSGSADIKLLV